MKFSVVWEVQMLGSQYKTKYFFGKTKADVYLYKEQRCFCNKLFT